MTTSAIERLREVKTNFAIPENWGWPLADVGVRLTRALVAEGEREAVRALALTTMRRHPMANDAQLAIELADAILEHFAAMALGEDHDA